MAQFNENEHPRQEDGKFAPKGEGKTTGAKKEEKKTPKMYRDDEFKALGEKEKEEYFEGNRKLEEEDSGNAYLTPDEYKKVADYAKAKGYKTDDVVDYIYERTGNKRKGIEQEIDILGKGKNLNRKDQFGNPLVSDEAFNVGRKALQEYIGGFENMAKMGNPNRTPVEYLKGSNVGLSYMQEVVSDAIEDAGLDPDFDLTEQDLNEIIGSVVGEEVDVGKERMGAFKGWTGKKYAGYQPTQQQQVQAPASNDIDYENITYPKGTSKEYTMQVNAKYDESKKALRQEGYDPESIKTNADAEKFINNINDAWSAALDEVRRKYAMVDRNKYREEWAKINEKFGKLNEYANDIEDKIYNDEYIKKDRK